MANRNGEANREVIETEKSHNGRIIKLMFDRWEAEISALSLSLSLSVEFHSTLEKLLFVVARIFYSMAWNLFPLERSTIFDKISIIFQLKWRR